MVVLWGGLVWAKDQPWSMARFDSWSIYQAGYSLAQLPHEQISHLVYGHLALDADGSIRLADPWADDDFRLAEPEWLAGVPGNLRQLRLLADRFSQMKTLVSLGGFAHSQYFSQVFADPAASALARQQLLRYIEQFELSGVELDWRNPDDSASVLADWQGYAQFVAHLRQDLDALAQSLGRPLLLGMTLPSNHSLVADGPLAAMVVDVDYFAPISYQMHGSWESVVRAPAALYHDRDSAVHQQSVDRVLGGYISRGVPAHKLLLVTAPQGMGWQMADGQRPQLFAGAAQAIKGTWQESGAASGWLQWLELEPRLQGGDWQQMYLPQVGANMMLSMSQGQIVLFDGPETIIEKAQYARRNGLLGMAMAEVQGDRGVEVSLWQLMVQQLHQADPWYRLWQQRLHRIDLGLLAIALVGLLMFTGYFVWYYRLRYYRQLQWQQAQQRQRGLHGQLILLQQLSERQFMLSKELVLLQPSPPLSDWLRGARQLPALAWLLPPLHSIDSFQPATQVLNPLLLLQSLLQTKRSVSERVQFEPPQMSMAVELQPVLLAETYSILLLLLADQQHTLQRVCCQVQSVQVQMIWRFTPVEFDHPDDLAKLNRVRVFCRRLGVQFSMASGQFCLTFKTYHPASLTQTTLDLSDPLSLPEPAEWSESSAMVSQNGDSDWQLTPSTNPEQMLRQLLQQLPELSSGQISILQSGELVAKVGDAKDVTHQTLLSDELTDYGLQVLAKQELSEAQLLSLRIFISQVAMIRRSLNALLRDGPLLNDLFQIGSRRDSLVYVHAERGYASLHEFKNGRRVAKSVVITLRLRIIKLYLDDEQLLQVHRSYLVAPSFVERAIRVNKNRFDLITPMGPIPIGRNYLLRLQQGYPQWFAAKG